jgi:hypothetical protein
LLILLVSCKSIPLSNVYQENDFRKFLYKSYVAEGSKYYSADLDIIVKNEDKRKIKGKIFLKNQEFIFANFTFLGFEIARAEISKDSIKFINRIDKSYFYGRIEDISSILNFNLNYFQIEMLIRKGIMVDRNDDKREFYKRISEKDTGYIYHYDEDITVKSLFCKETFELYRLGFSFRDSIFFVDATINRYCKESKYPEKIDILICNKDFILEADVIVGEISKERFEKKNFLINSKYSEIEF